MKTQAAVSGRLIGSKLISNKIVLAQQFKNSNVKIVQKSKRCYLCHFCREFSVKDLKGKRTS